MVLALVLGFVLPPRVVAGQDPAAVVRDVTVSPDTIEIGDRFDLRFTLELPGGTVAFLPDSLDTGAVESLGAVEWTATA
ncbi:MAG: hypothetical protein GWN71_16885, partial [Gammaproteobacteria bacterium]|nr:hypothetical protein [Gemmatimonadota bacterium]NIR37318.1 hypothetical protein [Actinomycetota bacterium]NIU75189.1 hypothetical protein [Gammaproteobacteria bacterium]NIX21146.1 hypothetical protein [Actinomycetota bacterium]